MNRPKKQSRRKFLYNAGIAGLGLSMLSFDEQFTGKQKTACMSEQHKKKDKLGVALVGLGNYATSQLAPALQQTQHCYLAGIVTGTPAKAEAWKAQYHIPEKNIYNYDNFDSISNNPDIDIVYVVLPNNMHADYTIRAARAGKHVSCEKPMALTVTDCDRMIAACKQAGKMLSIGYRLHFDPYHLKMAELGTKKVFGEIKKLSAGFGFKAEKGIWRLNKQIAGGGPLVDLGIYCFQAVCYTTGLTPVAVTAQASPISDTEKFIDIEETLAFQMEMPNGLVAECRTSYTDGLNYLKAEAAEGYFELQPAFNYSGLKGKTSNGILAFPPVSQQARQLDAFALAIQNNTPIIVPGEMGRRDVQIITAIYEAMHSGKRVMIPTNK